MTDRFDLFVMKKLLNIWKDDMSTTEKQIGDKLVQQGLAHWIRNEEFLDETLLVPDKSIESLL